MSHTADEVARWMFEELRNSGALYQTAAVNHIKTRFGEQFIYVNDNGHESIDKEVKKAFKKLHGGKAAWDRDAFYWGWTSAIKG
ncbi:DUF6953 family protein [Cohnella cholangitidis]|uniref:Integron gene cassette protein n=1 Tax=Cohnella cholangitidis TaxID=2598458 RepID=A0A7G5C0T5_9BACL|nr:hypothetical protein [Cohnella cholangitidis]QMV42819.1 hypothetical protein FPL14_17710 [Cohnella cholangitidis]